MGISNLRAILKKCAGPKQDVSNIATLFSGGTVAGPDISCKLVPWAKSIRGAEEYQSDPRIPASHVASQCLHYIRRLQRQNFHVIPIFDRMSCYQLKAKVVDEQRDAKTGNALSMLKRLLQNPWPSRENQQDQILSSIASNRHASVEVDAVTIANVVGTWYSICVAQFEAD